jgi:uncharacterized protein
MADTNPALDDKRETLLRFIRRRPSCLVAFSAGVDSTVLAKAAQLALGDRAVAATGVSAALAEGELAEAKSLAALIGIRHEIVETNELADPDYVANRPHRCYHCKDGLYARLVGVAARLNCDVVYSGAIVEDLGDYRPGLAAAAEHGVEHPLAACGITKSDVRALAAQWELPVADKPASPCLSSRIAYGEEVTPQRLAMVDKAEQLLRQCGFAPLRVRYHRGDLARIEVPLPALSTFCEPAFRAWVVEEFLALGFNYVTVDIAGFRSGSQNAVLPLTT